MDDIKHQRKNSNSQLFRRFLEDDSGQSTTEYVLILAVAVLIAMKFRQMFSVKMTTMLENLGSQIDKGLKEE